MKCAPRAPCPSCVGGRRGSEACEFKLPFTPSLLADVSASQILGNNYPLPRLLGLLLCSQPSSRSPIFLSSPQGVEPRPRSRRELYSWLPGAIPLILSHVSLSYSDKHPLIQHILHLHSPWTFVKVRLRDSRPLTAENTYPWKLYQSRLYTLQTFIQHARQHPIHTYATERNSSQRQEYISRHFRPPAPHRDT
ncbi:hypothetical protein DENSPDRAFT_266837 [Dentipellis sp. KUC8613]|nr:hypothetical protein DENSPDRAFT_266837 [Dentipellis sp. KUC8613]